MVQKGEGGRKKVMEEEWEKKVEKGVKKGKEDGEKATVEGKELAIDARAVGLI